MKKGSLTLRLSLMFVGAVVAVLIVAGVAFNELSRHHFRALDKQTLTEKLQATRLIISSPADPAVTKTRLEALFSAHSDLTARVLNPDGSTFFSAPESEAALTLEGGVSRDGLRELEKDGRLYRGLQDQVRFAASDSVFNVSLVLDATTHMHFFSLLQRWFWAVLVASAALSAVLGWVVARQGLRPVAQVTKVAASMSAGSLRERIPLGPVPDELRELIMSFNAMLGRLEESFIRLSDFSADIAHELRTPISNLKTHTEVTLARKRTPELYEENLFSNLEELNRISSMIDGMLFLAKADHGLVVPDPAELRLEDIVQKLFGYYELLAEDKAISLSLEGHGVVTADPIMVDRIISNLLSNALRYTPAGKTISVHITDQSNSVVLTVENPGPEISAEHAERIFDRFYRLDPARREGSGNAGLGLAIARSLMQAHGGQITCRSGTGTTVFELAFPKDQILRTI
jgi:two-component system heavy metal sensor histidine kinase CusS